MSDNQIYVLLTDTGTLFTSIIKHVTAAPYNHASLALDPELNRTYSFGRKQPDKPWFAGFVQEDVYEGTYRHYPDTRCMLLSLRVSPEQWEEATRVILTFEQNKQNYRYNLAGLFGVMMNVELNRKNAYFCSQFVAETLLRSGLALWDRPSSLITPEDFRRHPSFETIYEGRLYDYPLLDAKKIDSPRKEMPVSVRWRRQSV